MLDQDDLVIVEPPKYARKERLARIEKELDEILLQLESLGICITREDEDNEWDKVYTVECLDTTRVRDELELFIELCKA